MKQQLIAILLFSVFIGSSTFVLSMPVTQQHETNTITLSLTVSDLTITQKEEYISLSIPEGTGSTITATHPELPRITETLTLPFGSTIDSITFQSTGTESMSLDAKIIPVAYPTPIDTTIDTKKREVNQEIYTSSNPYPFNQLESKIAAGLNKGKLVNMLTLNWYPAQYLPTSNKLMFSKEITITITYTPGSPLVEKTNENKLVIIGPEAFADEAQPLVNHKNNLGLSTVYASLEQVYQQYEGRDPAEQIKYYLYDSAKNQGTTFVLLLGNVDITPMREASIHFFHDENIITDLYYADVFESDGSFSSWDSNNNDQFSEYNWDDGLIDTVDLYPDLYVGRIPCRTKKELQTVVDKIIGYENSAASSSWYHKILLMAGDTFPSNDILEGEIVTQHIANVMEDHGFEPVKLWTSQGTFNPLNINKEFTEGAGFISYSGHGYEQGFGTSPPYEEERIEYFSPFLIGIFNGDKLPVIFFDACSTTKLDFTIEELLEWYPTPLARLFAFLYGIEYEMDNFYPTISWQVVRKPNGGCIASIGSTRVAFTGVNEGGAHWGAGFLNTHFYEAYEPGAYLGELFAQCQTDYLNEVGTECITLEEFILVGDPSLQLG